jgi:AcrR family transcriptional regulator
MTVADVAKLAGVTRPTIYRRWPTKADLVTAAIANLERPGRRDPTDDVRADIVAVLHNVSVSFVKHRNTALLGSLLIEQDHSPELLALFRERLLRPRRHEFRAIIQHGIALGSFRPDIDVDAAVNAAIGSIYAKLYTGEKIDDRFISGVVDTLCQGMEKHDN